MKNKNIPLFYIGIAKKQTSSDILGAERVHTDFFLFYFGNEISFHNF